jgi:hypothetical protein
MIPSHGNQVPGLNVDGLRCNGVRSHVMCGECAFHQRESESPSTRGGIVPISRSHNAFAFGALAGIFTTDSPILLICSSNSAA